jgi:RNA polymerase sigma factor (sigma-70 family)
MTFDELMIDMATPGGFYYSIIDNITGNKKHTRGLISEIALSYLERRDHITRKLKEKDFRYYFIKTVTNQYKSKTSSFYKNMIKTHSDLDLYDRIEVIDDTEELEQKIKEEVRLKWLDNVIDGKSDIKMTWFENQMFRLYYLEGMTYRAIQQEWGINFLIVYNTVKELKEKIKKEL